MPKVQAVGIDLGTTYSAFARIDETGRSTMLRNSHGELLTPSVVLFDDAEIVVGKEAKKLLGTQTDRVADCVKRDMGSPAYSRAIRGAKIPPEVIQSCILRSLKADAVAAVGENFKTVITVPAYFDETRRKSTVDAAEMAGLEVLDIVNEPTAAALAYGENLGYLDAGGAPKREMNILVYDLGGGTFDVTVLNLKVGVVSTLATDGDVRLGGRDWDERLANFVAEQFCRTHGVDPRSDAISLARLLRTAEEAKHTLSARDHASVHVECKGRTGDVAITRAIFEELTEDLLERTAYTMRQVIASAKLTWNDIAHVLLVGGSTRMPMVSAMIERVSGRAPEHSVNPDEAVARGAAIFAGYLIALGDDRSPGPKFKVSDVNAHSLGIECVDQHTLRRENVVLIPRNTVLPAKASEKFMTKSANQQSIVVQVLEGESNVPQQCMPVARAVMRKLPANLPQGWPIEVTYEYGTNGRLSVKSQVPGTPQQLRLELERDNSLSDEKVSRWRRIITADAGFGAFEGMLEKVLNTTGLAGDEGQKVAQRPVEPAFRGQPSSGPAAQPAAAPSRPISLAGPAAATAPTASLNAAKAPAADDDAYELEYVSPEVVTEAPARAPIPEMPLVVRPRKSSNRAVMIALTGHILAPLIGIALGYYILCLIVPEANALNLPLPGLQVAPEPPDPYREAR